MSVRGTIEFLSSLDPILGLESFELLVAMQVVMQPHMSKFTRKQVVFLIAIVILRLKLFSFLVVIFMSLPELFNF